jgi:transcriptional regulator with XRE-family HTH domain
MYIIDVSSVFIYCCIEFVSTLEVTMSPSQCRAARGLLNWSQEGLATKASVSVTTLRNFERGATTPVTNNLAALRTALEAGGVEFIPENGGGAGVRLKKGSGIG